MEPSVSLKDYIEKRGSALGKSGVETATMDDVWNCYRLFLNREPDPAGFAGYCAIVARGMSVNELTRMFASSPEYAQRIASPPNPRISLAHLNGFDLYVPTADAVVGEEILQNGEYEPHVTAPLSDALHEGSTFIDVGANVGYYTILAARKIGPSGSVIAFEPLPRNVRLLVANAKINNASNVTVLPFGASDGIGFVTLLSMGSIASSRNSRLDDLITTNALEFSYATTIDAVAPPHRRIDVIKVDIDGYDYKAMLGAKKSLTSHHPQLFVEFAPGPLRTFSSIEPIEYLKYLVSCGYDDFTVLRRNGDNLPAGDDIERIARLPGELGLTHVDLQVRKL